VSTNLPVSTDAVSCYRALMVNFIWFTDENVHRISTTQHRGHEIISQPKNSTIS